MSTPITDDLWQARDGETFAYHSARIKDGTARLETDRAALMEALESFLNPSHPNRNKQTLLAVALTAARANFQQP